MRRSASIRWPCRRTARARVCLTVGGYRAIFSGYSGRRERVGWAPRAHHALRRRIRLVGGGNAPGITPPPTLQGQIFSEPWSLPSQGRRFYCWQNKSVR
jgi:hypothetical protein